MRNKKTYYIITIGCQMNKSDSERIAGYLEEHGYSLAKNETKASLVVLTTCGVRQSAEDRVYGLIGKIKKVNPGAKIILTGCLSQREDVKRRLAGKVDIWLPISQITNYPPKAPARQCCGTAGGDLLQRLLRQPEAGQPLADKSQIPRLPKPPPALLHKAKRAGGTRLQCELASRQAGGQANKFKIPSPRLVRLWRKNSQPEAGPPPRPRQASPPAKQCEAARAKRGGLAEKSKTGDSYYLGIKPKYSSSFSAFVPIGNGCNNFCAYCVVPYARGHEVYRPAEEILDEVRDLVKRGYKEIILIAQNVNSYHSKITNPKSQIPRLPKPPPALLHKAKRAGGTRLQCELASRQAGGQANKFKIPSPRLVRLWRKNSQPEAGPPLAEKSKTINFSGLLKLVNNIPGDFWIKFATSHPKDMSDELIKTVAESEKVCEHVHLPVQAGDNRVLKMMNRGYTREDYIELVRKIRNVINSKFQIPNSKQISKFKAQNSKHDFGQVPVSITTDVIVGFPGETKKQFANTVKLFKEIKFDMAYIARYSPRLGTAAYKLKDDVSGEEKKRREEELMKILRKTALENNKKYLGKVAEILIGGKNKKGEWYGYNQQNKNVKIRITNYELRITDLTGKFVKVKITKAKDFGLEGVIA